MPAPHRQRWGGPPSTSTTTWSAASCAILVDSSVWIASLHGDEGADTDLLHALVADGEAAATDGLARHAGLRTVPDRR